jgi:opacity protein-like surface antigen
MNIKMMALVSLISAMVSASSAATNEINWTGYYLGINSGYSFGCADAHYLQPAFSSYSVKSNPSGGTVGLQVGGNYEFKNHLVVGLETEISYADVSSTIDDTLSDAHGRPGNTITTSSDYAASARIRLGYALGRFLPYLTAGGTGADAKISATDGPVSQSDFQLGWAVGAGLEYALNKHWSLRAEYLHFDLGQHTWFAQQLWRTSSTLTSETIRFGINYKF